MPERILLDVDPGIDDALAILLALRSPETHVEAITTVAGNVPLEQTTENALKIVELAGRPDVVVARGADRPLRGKLTIADFVHGPGGIGGADLPAPRKSADPRPAVQVIAETLRAHPGQVTVVAVGPLTNLATAIERDPELAGQAKQFVVMGGAWSGGNVTPAAEFNIHADPEAAQAVLESGARLTMLTLEATRQALLKQEDLAGLDNCNPAVRAMLEHYIASGAAHGFPGAALHDPLAVGLVVDSTLVLEAAPVRMDVELEGRLTRGQTVVNRSLKTREPVDEGLHLRPGPAVPIAPNVTLPLKIDGDRFVRLLLERIAA